MESPYPHPSPAHALARAVARERHPAATRLAAMPDREPAAWETNAVAPFLTIEGAPVGVYALGEDRFLVKIPDREQLVVGYDEACRRAHARAAKPGSTRGVSSTQLIYALSRVTSSRVRASLQHANPSLSRVLGAGAASRNVGPHGTPQDHRVKSRGPTDRTPAMPGMRRAAGTCAARGLVPGGRPRTGRQPAGHARLASPARSLPRRRSGGTP
jgi:hypothetical protein